MQATAPPGAQSNLLPLVWGRTLPSSGGYLIWTLMARIGHASYAALGGAGVTLSPEEQQEMVERILRELEEEHQRREQTAEKKKRRRSSGRRQEERRQQEISTLQNTLRAKFYKERGYQLDLDRTGREVWLSPSEYALRNKKTRKKRRLPRLIPSRKIQSYEIVFFVLMCGSAVIMGLMLAR